MFRFANCAANDQRGVMERTDLRRIFVNSAEVILSVIHILRGMAWLRAQLGELSEAAT
jgi:hypothetical protein